MSTASSLQEFFTRVSNGASTRRVPAQASTLEDIVESGDFRIDTGNRTVALLGENLELSPEEFDVLMFLLNHPQRLITPHTVLATNWTIDQRRQTAFLRVLLSLRKKLDAAGQGKHYLRTEPWVVYRFDPSPSSP